MFGIDDWLVNLPPVSILLVVGGIILLESMGIPLPGEITLISASLLATTGAVNIWGVAVAASIGAIVGDSIGYAIGRRGGRPLLERFGRRFPKHFGPSHLARAERTFEKWGVWAVFFGRFVALLRILAGPLAGALRVPYRRFLIANASGGIIWATGTALVISSAGHVAEKYLQGFSWIALIVAIVAGIGTTIYLRRRAAYADALLNDDDEATNPTPASEIAAVAVHAVDDAARAVAAQAKSRANPPAQPKPPADTTARRTNGTRKAATHSRGKGKPGTGARHRPPKPRRG